jgi:hypothetical protein
MIAASRLNSVASNVAHVGLLARLSAAPQRPRREAASAAMRSAARIGSSVYIHVINHTMTSLVTHVMMNMT